MRTLLVIAFASIVIAGGVCRSAVAGERPAQTICPVTGKKLSSVASPVAVQANGFRFMVADDASRDKALENLADTFAALAKNNEAAEPISQACPIMGNRVNRNAFIQKDGYRVYICCKGCTKRVENNWPQVLDKLREQAEQGDPDDLPTM